MPELRHATTEKVCEYWRSHLGMADETLFSAPLRIITHAGELEGYGGVFALAREGAAVVSLPPSRSDQWRPLVAQIAGEFSLQNLASTLRPFASAVIGPAFIGYADHISPPLYPTRSLSAKDGCAVDALRAACGEIEWEHGGSDVREHPASGVFVGAELAALAGYEIWGGVIAHISIVARPLYRSRGFGTAAVAHLAARAIASGLIPQYRTLDANRASLRIADTLGFARFATSIAIRMNAR